MPVCATLYPSSVDAKTYERVKRLQALSNRTYCQAVLSMEQSAFTHEVRRINAIHERSRKTSRHKYSYLTFIPLGLFVPPLSLSILLALSNRT